MSVSASPVYKYNLFMSFPELWFHCQPPQLVERRRLVDTVENHQIPASFFSFALSQLVWLVLLDLLLIYFLAEIERLTNENGRS